MIQRTPNSPDTSLSLLGRLRNSPIDQQSWNEFVDRYGAMVFSWSRKWGLQVADAEDVTQAVLADLARQMQTFEYDPRGCFRGWLKTLAYRAWCDFLSKREKSNQKQLPAEAFALIVSPEAVEDFLEQIDRQAQQEILQKAMDIVMLQVQPSTWAAFKKTAIENLPGKQVAEQLDINIGTVYVAKSKVIKHLRKQVTRLSAAIAQSHKPD